MCQLSDEWAIQGEELKFTKDRGGDQRLVDPGNSDGGRGREPAIEQNRQVHHVTRRRKKEYCPGERQDQ